MKRAFFLGTATVLWVVGLQFISGAAEPQREIDLSQELELVGEARPVTGVNFSTGVGIALPSLPGDFFPTPTSAFDPRSIPAPTGTSVSTTTAPVTTTTAAPTTTAPATTAPTTVPATTTPATTAPPTTAPPTTAPPTTAPPTTAAPVPAGNFDAAAESDFAARINGLRASVGVGALAGHAELNNYARWWAKHMADTNTFAHSSIGDLLNPWTIVGENIAAGGNVAGLFSALSNSPGHYKNMVEPRFTAVGVGVYIDANGKMWTTHVFAG